MPFVFFDPPVVFFLFFDEPFALFIALETAPDMSIPPLFIDILFPPVVDVGVAACEGVVCTDEGPGESWEKNCC